MEVELLEAVVQLEAVQVKLEVAQANVLLLDSSLERLQVELPLLLQLILLKQAIPHTIHLFLSFQIDNWQPTLHFCHKPNMPQ